MESDRHFHYINTRTYGKWRDTQKFISDMIKSVSQINRLWLIFVKVLCLLQFNDGRYFQNFESEIYL